MSDFTTTTNFALKKPTVGQAVDLWGTYINSNFDEIDSQLQTLTVSIQTPDLEGLGNVLTTTPSTNDFLRFNGESWAAATVTIPSSIDDLSDVDTSTTAPTTGQALIWSGSKWSPSTPTAATIADASITTAKLDSGLQTQIGRILVTDDDDSPTNGQILQYSTADTEWKYVDLPGSTLVTLGDVDSASLADNALLIYNSSAGEFQFESGSTLRTTLGVDLAGTDNSTDITISSATSYDYITLSAGQVLTINQVNLGTDVTGTLPVAQGGTGGTTASAARTALGLGTIATQDSDDVTITGGNISGIVDLAIADGGTGASSVSAARTNLGLGALATQDTITESQISDLGSYITASSTDTLTNKSGNISQWTNDSGYLTAETNDLSNVSGTLAIANGGTGSSTAATARVALLPALATNGSKLVAVNSGATDIEYIATSTLSITESQISDLQSYLTAEVNDLSAAVTWANVPDVNITQSSVTQHQAALSITESQISDLGSYQPSDAGLTSIAGLTTTADKMLYTTASDTYAVADLTAAGRAILDDADATAQRTTLGLGSAATSDTSAFESAGSVSTHAALTEVHGISAFGATLVDDADAAAARTTLGLGTIATQDSDSITVTGGTATLGALTVSGSDSGNLVRITQTGSGNALVVEDSTNPDSTPFVVDNTGTVLIGSTVAENSSYHLEVKSGGNSVIKMQAGDSSSNYIGMGTANDALKNSINVYNNSGSPEMRFNVNSAVRMRIDSSGNVGIGTSPSSKLEVAGDVIIDTTDFVKFQVLDTTNSRVPFALSSGTNAFTMENDTLAAQNHEYIAFSEVDSSLRFGTDGTERMRIDSSGNLLVGYTSSNGSYKLQVNSQIYATSSTIATSDFNYKENITPLDGALSLVSQLNPVQFDWKEHAIHEFDRNQPTVGFIAQEVQQVLGEQPYLNSIVKSNECVLEPEETDEEGNVIKEAVIEEFLGIAEGNMIALLTKAIQEQQTLIESQQSQIDALTARIEALEATP